MADLFFIIFLSTIILTRVFLFLFPISSPTIGKYRIHHYMYGILGILLGLVTDSAILYAIGLGLFIDELTFLIIRGKSHKDNYSRKSLIGTIIFIVLAFIFKNYLITPFS